MPGFILADEVEALNYDFAPYVEVQGVIPEPSEAKVKEFQRGLRAIMAPVLEKVVEVTGDGKQTERDRLIAAVAAMKDTDGVASSEAEADKQMDLMLKLCAKVCSNTPTYAQIKALPYRPRQAFVGWLVGTFIPSGEALKPATS